MIRLLKHLFASLVLLSAIAGCASTSPARVAGQEYQLLVLHTNDHHGAIYPLEEIGGIAERATFIKEMRARNGNVLLLDAGDMNAGEGFSNHFGGLVDIAAYNLMGYDAVTFGNHEFDAGLPRIERQMDAAAFPFLAANVVRANGKTLGEPWIVKDYDGFRVGIFGITTKEYFNVPASGNALKLLDYEENAKAAARHLKAKEKCDIVIALLHLGLVENAAEAPAGEPWLPGVDLIIDGHSHTYIEKPRFLGTTPVFSAFGRGKFVGRAEVGIRDGKMTRHTWMPVKISGFAPDTEMLALIAPYEAKITARYHDKVAETSAAFEYGDRLPYKTETAIGNLISDAMIWYFRDRHPDIAIINGGSIRAGFPAGTVTYKDLYATLPHENNTLITKLKGRDVIELFRHIASVRRDAKGWAQVSGTARYTIDYTQGKQGVLGNLAIRSKPVDPEAEYTVVTNDFLMNGSAGYRVFTKGYDLYNSGIPLREIVIAYARHHGTLAPVLDGRLTIVE